MSNIEPAPGQAAWWRTDGGKDLVTAVALLCAAIGGFVFINPNGSSIYPGAGGLTWRTLPFIYAALLSALSVIYVIQSVAKLRRDLATGQVAPVDSETRIVLFRRVGTLGLLLGFVSLLKVVGFAMVAPAFLFLLFRLYKRGPILGDAGISLCGALALWTLFVPILKLNLKGDVFDPLTPALLGLIKILVP
ncbi:tripartite tricarboxylate transporter TctB family protein [Vannielia litorea]|uniref:Tripartite tricarboxylate transporter TctB family protein n=1 Tax=Vannielia litorea TaxID=1217970 RepID=A0A1N6E0H3_9RHOB|nr:tripartite tricarboxylate transporter TctB family protein [Vannielia litorea]SIN76492.1 Tripartite tricarboxylate transporter TctB family protein [Vannielia litorea]